MDFYQLASYFSKLEDTQSRIEMTKILAKLFHDAHANEIGEICYLLQGRVAPLYEPIEFGVADKLLIRSIASAFSITEESVVKEFKKTGDLGTTAQQMKATSHTKSSKSIPVSDVFATLKHLALSAGEGSQEKKIQLVCDLLRQLDPLSIRYVIRILLGKLRLGFSDMTILDAFSWMIAGDKSLHSLLEDAYNVRPDMAFIGSAIKKHGIKGVEETTAVVGAPILASLCARLPDAVEMIRKMGEVDVEPKYDGVRTQIHFTRTKNSITVQSFSRNLENTTSMYPELSHITKQITADSVIFDSEAIGYDAKSGKLIPFQETMTRKRKHDIDLVSQSLPLRFFIFDILYKDGKDLMSMPLSQRRALLEQTVESGDILMVSPHIVTSDVEELRKYHEKQLHLGLEGVVVKKWESPYTPGRKGYHWVKFKEEEGKTGKLTDTVDAVVMGFYTGEGKRSGFGIGAFLVGVKKGEQFVSVTKIGTGVTDDKWKELKVLFMKNESNGRPKQYSEVDKTLEPDVWVDPSIVVEIAADDITKSPLHQGGLALRFPRLVRVRDDKNPEQATTIQEIEIMYKSQKNIQ